MTMSKVLKWKYHEYFHSQLRREKLINMLLSEIVFLKINIKKYHLGEDHDYIKIALGKLEYLLNLLKNNDSELSDLDFDKVIMFIYEIFKNIVINLEEEL